MLSVPRPAPAKSEKLVVESGLKLHDLVPIIFPSHDLIKHLKAERDLLRTTLLTQYWRDHGRDALIQDMCSYNLIKARCMCVRCSTFLQMRLEMYPPQHCKFWDRFTWFLSQVGLVHCFVVTGEMAGLFLFDERTHLYFPDPRLDDRLTFSTHYPVEFIPEDGKLEPPAGFDENKACPYMKPVSHLRAHIVFARRGDVYSFAFGRLLWEAEDVVNSPETRKLALLRAKLQTIHGHSDS
jgi:hypothetical protein